MTEPKERLSGGSRIIVHAEIDSTNSEGMRLAASGEMGPLWIRAERQTRGRGRSGRSWSSEPGNLYASHVRQFAAPLRKAYQLSLVTGICVLDAIRRALPEDEAGNALLKWPNDVLLGGAKCAGILVESMSMPNGGFVAVVGIGINIAWAPEDIGRPVTHLSARGSTATAAGLLELIDEEFSYRVKSWRDGADFSAIRTAWLARCSPIGEPMTVQTGEGAVSGAFRGIDDEGALLLDVAGGGERRFTFGDVSLGAPPTAGRLDS